MRDAGVVPRDIALAAALARPEGPVRPVVLHEPADTLGVLRRNKVPLLSLNEAAQSSGFLQLPEISEAREADRVLLGRLRFEYERVLKAFDGQGIGGVFVKSVGLAPSFPYTSDNLDVLVPMDRGVEARRALRRIGYCELTNLEEPDKFLLRRFHTGVEVATVHVHTHVGWCVSFFDEAVYLERSRSSADDAPIWVPSLEDGALTNMAHSLYENKEVKLSDLQKLEHCWSADLDWEYMRAAADRKGWLDGLYFCVLLYDHLERSLHGVPLVPDEVLDQARSGLPDSQTAYFRELQRESIHMPFPISFVFSKRLYYRKIRNNRTIDTRSKIANAIRHTANGFRLKSGVRSQSPMLIAISGTDGAGKSEQAKLLRQAFDACAIRSRVVWSRGCASPFTDACLRVARRFWGRKKAPLSGDAMEMVAQDAFDSRRAMLGNPVARWGWSAVVVTDLLVQYWLRVVWPLLRGHVVIADRYTADAEAELAAYLDLGPGRRSMAGRILAALTPRPQMSFLLDLAPEVAEARMGEGRESVAYLQRLREIHLEQARRTGAIVLDAARPLEEVSDEVVYRTLTRYFDRYRTLINGFFLANPSRVLSSRPEGENRP
jgi:thymidylate kinase